MSGWRFCMWMPEIYILRSMMLLQDRGGSPIPFLPSLFRGTIVRPLPSICDFNIEGILLYGFGDTQVLKVDNAAMPDRDFKMVEGRLEFKPYQMSATIEVPIIDDASAEKGDERRHGAKSGPRDPAEVGVPESPANTPRPTDHERPPASQRLGA